MSVQRLTMMFAGLFVGANLTFAGLTGFYLMTKIMKAFGAK